MEAFKWKENYNTIFGGIMKTKGLNKKLYLVFTDQCDPYLKTKIKGNKEYNKTYNMQDGIKIFKIIRSIICGAEEHLQVTRATM